MEIKVIASGSTGNAYRVSDGVTSLLLDAGVPLSRLRPALGFRVSALDGCLVTHCHMDHSKAAGELLRAGVPVYTSTGTIEALALAGHRVKRVQALKEIEIGSFTVLPFDVQHDAPEPLGFLLTSRKTGEKLLYLTDSYYVKYTFSGLTHIMCECNYSEEALQESIAAGYVDSALAKRLRTSHMSLDHFLDLLRANDLSRVRQIYLLHLSSNNSDAERFREATEALTGCEVYVC